MVNWQDPQTEYHTTRALILIVHAFFGVYLWEILTSISYDWDIIVGRRRRSLAAIIYLLTRYAALIAWILGIVSTNAVHPINCERLYFALYAHGFSAVALASGLLYLRVCAISANYKPFVIIFGLAYLGYWAITIKTIVIARAIHVPQLFLCTVTNLSGHRTNTLYTLAFDLSALAVILWYLLRMGTVRRSGSLWGLLFQQGVVHVATISATYIGSTVLQSIQLNAAMTRFPEYVLLMVVVTCATRMQRTLDTFGNQILFQAGSHPSYFQTGRPTQVNVHVGVERHIAVTGGYSTGQVDLGAYELEKPTVNWKLPAAE